MLKNKEKNEIPLCYKCGCVMKQLFFDKSEEVVGCKDLSKQKWDEGWKQNDNGIWQQRNCPLLKGKNE